MRYREPFPKPGDLVVAQVESISKHSVQVKLEDYTGLEHEDRAHGMIHISELSNRWVKNINNLVSVGQRLVLSVLRVNEQKGYVDLSLRRVNDSQKQAKMNEWRYNKKIEGLLEFFAQQHGMTLDELYDRALFTIIDIYGDFRTAFETIKEEGFQELENIKDKLDLTEEQIKDLYQLIEENVKIPTINIVGEFEIISYEGNGIEIVKDALLSISDVPKPKGLKTQLIYIGAPIYRIEVEAKDYPTAEKYLQAVEKKVKKGLKGYSFFEFHRDQLSNEQT